MNGHYPLHKRREATGRRGDTGDAGGAPGSLRLAERFSCGGVSGHADSTEEGIAGALHALGGVEVGGGGRARKAGAAGVVDHRHSAARRCGSSRMALPELGLPRRPVPPRTPIAAPLTRCSKPSAAARPCRPWVCSPLALEQCCEARLAAEIDVLLDAG